MHTVPLFAGSSTRHEFSLALRAARRRAPALCLGLALVLPGFVAVASETAKAQVPKRAGAVARVAKSDAEWGEAVGGLRARVVAVAPDTDEQKPDFTAAKRVAEYDHPDDVTLLVELKNVSQQPIAIQGTRYGDNVTPPWPGKSASETFAPYLFDCEYLDNDGKPIEFPSRKMIDGDLMMSLS